MVVVVVIVMAGITGRNMEVDGNSIMLDINIILV